MRAIATVLNDGIVVLTLLHQGEFHVILDPRERWSPDGGEREAEPRHDVAAVEVVRDAARVWRCGAAQPNILRPRPASTKPPPSPSNAASSWNGGARGPRCRGRPSRKCGSSLPAHGRLPLLCGLKPDASKTPKMSPCPHDSVPKPPPQLTYPPGSGVNAAALPTRTVRLLPRRLTQRKLELL